MPDETVLATPEPEIQCRTLKEMLLYKLDRSIAIAGLVAIGVYSVYTGPELKELAMAVITAIGVFLGMKGK